MKPHGSERYRSNTNLNECFMLLSYDPDLLNMFKIILNAISNIDYSRKFFKTSMFIKKSFIIKLVILQNLC
jgi:hypothetical protein